MAGSLIKIDEEIVSSGVSSVTLTGIDSTYDVYMVKFNNFKGSSDNNNLELRLTESGTPNTTSNYDYAYKKLDATTTFANQNSSNQSNFDLEIQVGNDTGEQSNGVLYILNANNSSEYTFITIETSFLNPFVGLNGTQGGGVFTVTSAVDGVNIFFSSGNIASGTISLYGLKK